MEYYTVLFVNTKTGANTVKLVRATSAVSAIARASTQTGIKSTLVDSVYKRDGDDPIIAMLGGG